MPNREERRRRAARNAKKSIPAQKELEQASTDWAKWSTFIFTRAMLIALHQEFGFGLVRGKKVVDKMQSIIGNISDNTDTIQALKELTIKEFGCDIKVH